MNDFMVLGIIILKILAILLPVVALVALSTLAERKVISYIQVRIGPNRVGTRGILQPVADIVKLLTKEVITPSASSRFLFVIAPILSLVPALVAWAVIPVSQGWVISNINAGVLFVYAMASLGIYGIMVGGWASNSKYSFYGALRAAAQVISYEIAMGFTLVGIILVAGTMNLQQIVMQQQGGLMHWYFWPLFPLFVVYWIVSLAETNRAPFDVAEGESEIVAGFHVEYSGMGFAVFFLAEYANMILVSALISLFFLGGWMSPIPTLIPNSILWFLAKACFFMYLFFWMRATFPRYRYDQIMFLGWKVLIPLTIFWVILLSFGIHWHIGPWFK